MCKNEDQDAYIDQVAQAVIDRIEERDRVAGLVERVAQRVMQMQKENRDEALLIAVAEREGIILPDTAGTEPDKKG